SFPIMLRAMRDIQPLKFFGGIAAMLFLLGFGTLGFVSVWYFVHSHKTSPFTSLIPIGGVLLVLSFLMGALALLADMLGRHRRISGELLYLARRRIYSTRRAGKASSPPPQNEVHAQLPPAPDAAPASLHGSWCLPVL